MYEFSLKGYQELLLTFKNAGYSFRSFDDFDHYLTDEKPFILLRHDIDISLRPALEIARLEQAEGIAATYFVSLHSPFYNLLSRQNADALLEIHRMGHTIALHMDLAAYENDCFKAIGEIDLLKRFYSYTTEHVASIHSPINLKLLPLEHFEQLWRVYGHMMTNAMAYISDSTGRWRYGHPLDSETFYQRKPMQLLTHPIWWVQDGDTPPEKLKSLLYKEYLHSLAIADEFLPKLFREKKS